MELFGDLIVAESQDTYNNLTLKTMAIMEWVSTYCNKAGYVLKTDDDMFINVPNLFHFIDEINVSTNASNILFRTSSCFAS